MHRSLLTSQRVFPLVLVLTLAIALAPGNALGVPGFFAEVFSLVLTPFVHPLNSLGAWLRPEPMHGLLAGVDTNIEHLQQDAVDFERLYIAEQAKVEALEKQIEQLQGFAPEGLRIPVQPILAHVALRSPTSAFGKVTLNRGTKHGVKPGTIAVFNRAYIVGRICDDVWSVQSTLMPLTNVSTGTIGAAVLPHDRNPPTLSAAPTLPLTPRGDGTFVASPDKSEIISVGDEVVLKDETWPLAAQGMRIGIVEDVRPNDMQPLRSLVIVRPPYQIAQLAYVTLKIEQDAIVDAGSSREGSSP